MGTKMLRGPSLKSLSLLRTVCLLQIMILTISGGGKGCYLDNFSSKSGKIMICDRQTVLSRLKLFRDGSLSILVPMST